jgi:hypothetical protein
MTTRRKPDSDLVRYREVGLAEAQWAKIDAGRKAAHQKKKIDIRM